jgi:hypothetical protein
MRTKLGLLRRSANNLAAKTRRLSIDKAIPKAVGVPKNEDYESMHGKGTKQMTFAKTLCRPSTHRARASWRRNNVIRSGVRATETAPHCLYPVAWPVSASRE